MTTFTIPTRGWEFFSRPARPFAGTTPPHDTNQEKAADVLQAHQRPTTGRTSSMGRKVEKPGSGQTAGPSGQHEAFSHELKHTNK